MIDTAQPSESAATQAMVSPEGRPNVETLPRAPGATLTLGELPDALRAEQLAERHVADSRVAEVEVAVFAGETEEASERAGVGAPGVRGRRPQPLHRREDLQQHVALRVRRRGEDLVAEGPARERRRHFGLVRGQVGGVMSEPPARRPAT